MTTEKSEGYVDIKQASMYFWLGADGEVEECTEEEFTQKQLDLFDSNERWRNVQPSDVSVSEDNETPSQERDDVGEE